MMEGFKWIDPPLNSDLPDYDARIRDYYTEQVELVRRHYSLYEGLQTKQLTDVGVSFRLSMAAFLNCLQHHFQNDVVAFRKSCRILFIRSFRKKCSGREGRLCGCRPDPGRPASIPIPMVADFNW